MKITGCTTHIVRVPADNPLVIGLPEREDTREFVTLELQTDAGLTGVGLTFFGGALTGALKAAVDGFAELAIGEHNRIGWLPTGLGDATLMQTHLQAIRGAVSLEHLLRELSAWLKKTGA